MLREPQRVAKLRDNVAYARTKIKQAGFEILESPTAICPIIVHDTAKAIAMSQRLLELGVFVIGFAMFGAIVYMPVYLQVVQGHTPKVDAKDKPTVTALREIASGQVGIEMLKKVPS